MRRSMNGWAACIVVVLVAAGCGKGGSSGKTGKKDAGSDSSSAPSDDSKPTTPEEQAAEMAKAAEDAKNAYKQMNGGKDIKAVDAKELKAILPEMLGGAKRGHVESTHTNTMGMDVSETDGDYETPTAENDDGSHPKPGFRVKITDMGSASGAMSMGYAAWAMSDFSRETDTGYEKTIKYKGFPGHETYNTEDKNGQTQVLVAKRFVLEVSGRNASADEIRAALDAIDLSKLGSLAK